MALYLLDCVRLAVYAVAFIGNVSMQEWDACMGK
jgi:hypothetical protein